MVSAKMNLAEIIGELPKLTAEERQAIYRQIEELDKQRALLRPGMGSWKDPWGHARCRERKTKVRVRATPPFRAATTWLT
jgi:hypothetical protein